MSAIPIPDTLTILATSDDGANEMKQQAEADGHEVSGVKVWHGVVPPHSYMRIAPGLRMSTPEFFFFRMCNQLEQDEAIAIGDELCGHYRTWKTAPDLDEGAWEPYPARTTIERLFIYTMQVCETDEAKTALDIIMNLTPNRVRP